MHACSGLSLLVQVASDLVNSGNVAIISPYKAQVLKSMLPLLLSTIPLMSASRCNSCLFKQTLQFPADPNSDALPISSYCSAQPALLHASYIIMT